MSPGEHSKWMYQLGNGSGPGAAARSRRATSTFMGDSLTVGLLGGIDEVSGTGGR